MLSKVVKLFVIIHRKAIACTTSVKSISSSSFINRLHKATQVEANVVFKAEIEGAKKYSPPLETTHSVGSAKFAVAF